MKSLEKTRMLKLFVFINVSHHVTTTTTIITSYYSRPQDPRGPGGHVCWRDDTLQGLHVIKLVVSTFGKPKILFTKIYPLV